MCTCDLSLSRIIWPAFWRRGALVEDELLGINYFLLRSKCRAFEMELFMTQYTIYTGVYNNIVLACYHRRRLHLYGTWSQQFNNYNNYRIIIARYTRIIIIVPRIFHRHFNSGKSEGTTTRIKWVGGRRRGREEMMPSPDKTALSG